MIQAAFFDVDGTLLSHRLQDVPQSAREAVRQMRENGILCVVASGRSLGEVEWLPTGNMEFDGYVLMNGQLILDHDKKVLASNPIEGSAKEKVLALFEEKKIPVLLVTEQGLVISFVNEHVEIAQKAVSSPIPRIGKYEGGPVYMAIAYFPKEQEEAMRKALPECSLTRWNEFAMDIVPAGMHKQKGIEQYLQIENIPSENTIAFGDGDNDREMITHAGIGVAMADGDPHVLAIADFIAEPVEDDGLAKATRHFGLMNKR